MDNDDRNQMANSSGAQKLEQVKKVLEKTEMTEGKPSKWRLLWMVLAVLYVLSPIDLIPDAVPVAGLADDAVVILISLLTFFFNKSKNK